MAGRVGTRIGLRRIVFAVLITAIGWWAIMIWGTLAHVRNLAGGLDPFDVRPGGYSTEDARALLSALGADGRDFYAHVQLRLDTVYPALFAASRTFLIWWLTVPGRVAFRTLPVPLRGALVFPAIVTAALDYSENNAIAQMLAAGPAVTPEVVAFASHLTQAKSVASTLTETTWLVLALLAAVRWFRARRDALAG